MSVRVRLLVAGHSLQSEWFSRRSGGLRRVRFPATFALLEVPGQAPALFDTGYSARFFSATGPFPQRLYRLLLPVAFSPAEAATAQLGALGVLPDAVGTVVLSHLHGDHIAGLRDFPAARIVRAGPALPPEVEPGARPRARVALRTTRHGFLPELLPPDLVARSTDAAALPMVATGLPGFGAGHDLFGDGRAVLVPMPGHAPGHLGLWLPRTQGRPLFLVGDACWHREAFLSGDLPPRPVLAMLGEPAASAATVERLAALARSRPDVLVVPSHCAASVAAAQEALG